MYVCVMVQKLDAEKPTLNQPNNKDLRSLTIENSEADTLIHNSTHCPAACILPYIRSTSAPRGLPN